jgi:hypothetical protein
MAIASGVGISHHRNPKKAAREAAEQAMAGCGRAPDFVFLWASVGYPQEVVVQEVRAVCQAPVCGCSGEGVIAGHEADETNFSVAVLALASEDLRITHGLTSGLKEDPAAVGRSIGEALAKDFPDDAIALFVFPDGMTVNFDKMRAGLEGALPALPDGRSLPLLGGTASDNLKFERTYQYCDDEVTSDGVAWALLSGPSRAAWTVNHGCIPVGVEHKVTRAEGNVILELDHRPAAEVVLDYVSKDEMGDWMKVVMTLSLALKAPVDIAEAYDQYLIRTLVGGLDPKAGSVTIADEVATGQSVWIAQRDFEKMQVGTQRSCQELLDKLGGAKPELIFHFDCAGRGKSFLKEQEKTELLRSMQARLGRAPWAGFYCYGEISPVSGKNAFHNLTMVLAALY